MPNISNTSRLAFIVSLDNSNFLKNSEILNKRLAKFGTSLTKFGQSLTRSLSLITGILNGFAVSTAATFDEIASQVQAVTGGSGFKELIKDARRLGRSTKFTGTEVLTLTRELKKLGLSIDETQEGVEKTIGVVTVFGGDLIQTGDAIASLTRQFRGLEFGEAADVLSVAFRKTALSTDNFREAFKNVGAVANATNLSFTKTVATLGALANSAQRGGIGGTRFKGVLTRLAAEGFNVSEGLLAVQSGTLEFANLLEFFKLRPVVAAAAISEMGLEIEKLDLLLQDSTNASTAFSDAMRDRLFFQVARTRAAIEDIGISLGYAFAPVITRVADLLEYLADRFSKLNSEEAQALAGNALFVIALGPLIFGLGQLAIALAAIFTPAGILLTVLAGMAAAAVRAQTKFLLLNTTIAKSNEVLADYRGELKKVQGDLSNFSTAELEGSLARLKGQFTEDGLKLLEEEEVVTSAKNISEIAKLFGAIGRGGKDFFGENLAGDLFESLSAIFGLDAQSIEFLDLQLAAAGLRRLQYLKEIQAIEAELAEREAERARIAAENLEKAKALGLLNADQLAASEDLFADVIEKLRKNVAEFGVASGKTKAAIKDLNDLDAAEFADAMIGKFPQLLDDFGALNQLLADPTSIGVGTDSLRALEKQFLQAAEAFLEIENVPIAKLFSRLAKSYGDAAKAFEQSDLVKTLNDSAAATRALNFELDALGQQGLGDTLGALLSEATGNLKELLAIPESERTQATKDRIKEITDEIKDLNAQITREDIGDKIDSILNPSVSDFGSDLVSPFAAQDTASPISSAIRQTISDVEGLRQSLQDARENGVDPTTIALGQQGLEGALTNLQQLFAALELATFNDNLAKTQERLNAITALENEGFISGFDAARERVDLLTKELENAAIATQRGVIIDPDVVKDLKTQLAEATAELRNFYLAGLLLRAVQGFANQMADAFREAKESGRRFGEVLKESLERTFRELIAKLIVLTGLFLLLSALSGGTGAIAGVASNAISGGFTSFVGEGLIGGAPGLRNLGTLGGSGGGSAPSLRVEGFLSGNNVVISNQRGTRAIDRTFG